MVTWQDRKMEKKRTKQNEIEKVIGSQGGTWEGKGSRIK